MASGQPSAREVRPTSRGLGSATVLAGAGAGAGRDRRGQLARERALARSRAAGGQRAGGRGGRRLAAIRFLQRAGGGAHGRRDGRQRHRGCGRGRRRNAAAGWRRHRRWRGNRNLARGRLGGRRGDRGGLGGADRENRLWLRWSKGLEISAGTSTCFCARRRVIRAGFSRGRISSRGSGTITRSRSFSGVKRSGAACRSSPKEIAPAPRDSCARIFSRGMATVMSPAPPPG